MCIEVIECNISVVFWDTVYLHIYFYKITDDINNQEQNTLLFTTM